MMDYRANWICSCGALNSEPKRGGVCRKCGTEREEAMLEHSLRHKRRMILEGTKSIKGLEEKLKQCRERRAARIVAGMAGYVPPSLRVNEARAERGLSPIVMVHGYSSHSWLGKPDATMTFHMGRLFPVPDIERL